MRWSIAGGPCGERPLTGEELRRIDAYWRAADYLSVGQIHLLAKPWAVAAFPRIRTFDLRIYQLAGGVQVRLGLRSRI